MNANTIIGYILGLLTLLLPIAIWLTDHDFFVNGLRYEAAAPKCEKVKNTKGEVCKLQLRIYNAGRSTAEEVSFSLPVGLEVKAIGVSRYYQEVKSTPFHVLKLGDIQPGLNVAVVVDYINSLPIDDPQRRDLDISSKQRLATFVAPDEPADPSFFWEVIWPTLKVYGLVMLLVIIYFGFLEPRSWKRRRIARDVLKARRNFRQNRHWLRNLNQGRGMLQDAPRRSAPVAPALAAPDDPQVTGRKSALRSGMTKGANTRVALKR